MEKHLIPVLFQFFFECLSFDRSICGVRARVEFSTGKSKPKPWQVSPRRGPLPSRRAFDPEDRCYECGQRGHYAYDCEIRLNKRKGMLVRTDDVLNLKLICYICECLILAKILSSLMFIYASYFRAINDATN